MLFTLNKIKNKFLEIEGRIVGPSILFFKKTTHNNNTLWCAVTYIFFQHNEIKYHTR